MATNNKLFGNKFTVEALTNTFSYRATRGVLYIILDDATVPAGLYVYNRYKEVVESWDSKNKDYITTAFVDYKVKKVVVASGHNDAGISGSLSNTLKLLNKVRFNGWMVAPQITNETEKKKLADFVKLQRQDEDYPVKAVLYNYKADNEGIVNWTGDNLGIDNYTSEEYCVDVASVLCTLGANEAITNYVAKKVKSCDIKDDNDTCVANGELFLINNGTNIVFSNGVNSLQTIPKGQNEYLTHIRVVEVVDMVKDDINTICNEKFTGKIGNSFSNRRTINNYFNSYLSGLKGYLSNDDESFSELDAEATREYLESLHNIENLDEMEDDEVLRQKLGTYAFYSITLYVMDVIESINFKIKYEI